MGALSRPCRRLRGGGNPLGTRASGAIGPTVVESVQGVGARESPRPQRDGEQKGRGLGGEAWARSWRLPWGHGRLRPSFSQAGQCFHSAQGVNREEELGVTGHPACPVQGQATGGHHEVEVGMVVHLLAPGVEQGQEADASPEVPGVDGDFQEGMGGRLEEEAVDGSTVLQGQRSQESGQREDDVGVGDGKEVGTLGVQPLGRLAALALGAVPVPARVVGDPSLPTLVALVHVPAQRRSPALEQG